MTCADDASAYEALRAQVLTGVSSGSHGGLIVLLRKGMAAWMARRSIRVASIRPATYVATPVIDGDLHAAIVQALANVALACQNEVSA
jgi:hypothetical protein